MDIPTDNIENTEYAMTGNEFLDSREKRYAREQALSYAMRVHGKHARSEDIVATALSFAGFLSGETAPTEDDLRAELRLYADTIKSLEVTIENLQKKGTPAQRFYERSRGYRDGMDMLVLLMWMRAQALGLSDDSTVTVGQVLREVDSLVSIAEA